MTSTEVVSPSFDEARVDRFAFGANWQDFLGALSEARIAGARADIVQWLGTDRLDGASVLDIGCGSGVHSYCLHGMGAERVTSFDYDADSVAATRSLHQLAGAPPSWTVDQGSVLDSDLVQRLGTHHLVYSWGVLHHTGQMWQAIANAATCVMPGGYLFIAIYAKGPQYSSHLALKQRYHDATVTGKRKMEFDWILDQYANRARLGIDPAGWWNAGHERGMDSYIDLVDWLGGLPYEVATMPELEEFLGALNFETVRKRESDEGGCHVLLAERMPMVR